MRKILVIEIKLKMIFFISFLDFWILFCVVKLPFDLIWVHKRDRKRQHCLLYWISLYFSMLSLIFYSLISFIGEHRKANICSIMRRKKNRWKFITNPDKKCFCGVVNDLRVFAKLFWVILIYYSSSTFDVSQCLGYYNHAHKLFSAILHWGVKQ